MSLSNRNLLIGLAVLAFVIIGWLIFRGSQKQEILNLDSKGTSVVAFGDSLVEGVGATQGKDFVSLLSRNLGLPIVNLGKSGDTTASALERVDSIFENDPGVVIVLLGGNDYLRRVPMSQTFANLSKIVTTIQSKGAAVLLLGVRGGLLYDSYDDDFASFAKAHKVGFVPNVLDGLVGDTKLMSDSIHPNDAGYEKIAAKVLPVLRSMFAD